MTKDEARIVLLEQALCQAISTIGFLDGCLREPGMFHYSYPDQTERHLKEFKELVTPRKFCVHSGFVPDCEGCQQRIEEWNKRDEALKTLGIKNE